MEKYKKELILYGQATQDDCSAVLSTSPGRGVPASPIPWAQDWPSSVVAPGPSWWLFLSRGGNGLHVPLLVSLVTNEPLCECLSAWVLSPFSRIWLFVTLWTVASQASLFMGFPRQEHWSRLPCHPPGDLPNPEIKPATLASPALAGRFFTTSATWETHWCPHLTSIPL